MSNNQLPKKISKLIIISLLFSIFFSISLTYKYDRLESDNSIHALVKGDSYPIWKRAENFKNDLMSGKGYLSSGSELYRSYLPLRTIAFFSILFDYELFADQGLEKIKIDKKKFLYLIFQAILYYKVLFHFLKKIQNYLDTESLFYSALFLCICPSIILFHSSFHTESIFFSLQLLFLFYIMNPSPKLLINIFYGFLLGLMFLQKSVAIFYIFLIIPFLILNFKKKSFIPVTFLAIGYVIVLSFVGYGNLKRMNVFYFQPTQTSTALQRYVSGSILQKKMKIDNTAAELKIKNDSKNWLNENNINLDNEIDRLLFYKYQKKYSIDLILGNPIISIKHMGWKYFQTAMIAPLHILQYYHWEEKRDKIDNKFYLTKDYKKIWWPINISYSLTIYVLVLIGFINSFKVLDIKLNYLFIASSLYMFAMLGWVGQDRYMLPSLIYLSVYFGIGVATCKQKFKKIRELN
jgi:hypothetical protein